jgi:hypothetical protein
MHELITMAWLRKDRDRRIRHCMSCGRRQQAWQLTACICARCWRAWRTSKQGHAHAPRP